MYAATHAFTTTVQHLSFFLSFFLLNLSTFTFESLSLSLSLSRSSLYSQYFDIVSHAFTKTEPC